MISYGDADVMVTGGVEACIVPVSMAGFCKYARRKENSECCFLHILEGLKLHYWNPSHSFYTEVC